MAARACEQSACGTRRAPPVSAPTIAIIMWGVAFDDFLQAHGLTLETFATDMNGGWLFG